MPNKPWHQYMYSECICGGSTCTIYMYVCTYQWIECKSECCVYTCNYNILSYPNHTSVDDLVMTYTTIAHIQSRLALLNSVNFRALTISAKVCVKFSSLFWWLCESFRVFMCVCVCVRVCVRVCVFVCEYILFHYQLPTSVLPYHLSLPSWELA